MVVLYMARDNKCNSPAGRGVQGHNFTIATFSAICTMRAHRQAHYPDLLSNASRPPAVPHPTYSHRPRDQPFDRPLEQPIDRPFHRTLARRFEHPRTTSPARPRRTT